jgi:hypothetical protein
MLVETYFLVDTGADCTVLSAATLANLDLAPLPGAERIGGLGGTVASIAVETELHFRLAGTGRVTFQGQYRATTDIRALDLSVLGRDITGLFSVIVDQPGNVVCLLSQRHYYRVEER